MRTGDAYIGDKVDEIFRREGYDASPTEIDHSVELRGNYLFVEFHEPPLYEQQSTE